MHDFVHYVVHLAGRGLWLALPMVVLCIGLMAGLYWGFRRRCKGERPFPWRKAVYLLLLVVYGAVLIYVTLLRLDGHIWGSANLRLFRAWREAWYQCSVQGWLNVLLNVALLVPLGVLLPLLIRRLRSWYWLVAAGFGTSLAIETLQGLTGRGIFDVDDLFCNTLGALLGWCGLMCLLHLLPGEDRSLRAAGLCLLPVLAVAGVLGGLYGYYQSREYGNLPETPFFRAEVRGVDWETGLAFEDEPRTAPVYRTEPFTRESCEAFGRDFARRAGFSLAEEDVIVYDNCTMFLNHSTGDFLTVNYFDRSYVYCIGQEPVLALKDLSPAEQKQALGTVLEGYGIAVPEEAVLIWDDTGNAILVWDMVQMGERLLDGTLTFRFLEGERLAYLENQLTDCSWYGEVPILSPAEAWTQLVSGHFSNGDFFESMAPDRVVVLDYRLAYRMDSKGFYRPVYLFACDLGEGEQEELLVPAMK